MSVVSQTFQTPNEDANWLGVFKREIKLASLHVHMDTTNYISLPLLFKSQGWVEAGATCFRQHDFNKSISGDNLLFSLVLTLIVFLRGFRKRWLAGSSSGSAPLAAADAPESELEEEDPSDKHAVSSFDFSDGVTKKLRVGMSDIAIESAFKLLRQPVVKMPWEKGPLAAVFTGQFPMQVDTKLPSLTRVGLEDLLTDNTHDSKQPVADIRPVVSLSGFVKKRITASKFNLTDDDLRIRALGRFRHLICSDLKGTKVGLSLLDKAGQLCGPTELATIISDTLAHKATGTLLKRASSMTRFFSWIVQHRDTSCFRASEQDLYDYINFLRQSNSGATSAAHFEQAFRMCHEVLGMLHIDIDEVMSARVTGASHSMFLTKKKLSQAPALTVEAIKVFEDICIHSEFMHKRVIAGSILFCIFSAARWFDAMHITEIGENKFGSTVLLEADTEKHKTSMSKEAKTRLLPFVCLGRFLSEKAWGTSFMEARGTFGISKPFLPSWNESSQTFGTHRMTTCEATCWMHELLEPEIGAANALRFSSHSCKATILTWAGMCNLFTREERTLLGHHVEAQTRSSTTYNRDSQVLLQYKVAKMINLVKSGKLKPDASRSERLSMMLEEGVTDDDADQRLEPEVDLASSDDESDDVGSPVAELALSGSEKETPSEHDGFSIVGDVEMWCIHNFTGVAHYQMDEADQRLACGRAITTNLRTISRHELDRSSAVFCKQCEAAYKKSFAGLLSDVAPSDESH